MEKLCIPKLTRRAVVYGHGQYHICSGGVRWWCAVVLPEVIADACADFPAFFLTIVVVRNVDNVESLGARMRNQVPRPFPGIAHFFPVLFSFFFPYFFLYFFPVLYFHVFFLVFFPYFFRYYFPVLHQKSARLKSNVLKYQ